ncbi:uncharacterized protein [Syngnathus scovelli]|uniref:uncharacterized protein n=1 Tax=Syngnathus scovelli TaxID=161590 RepID=UPI00211026B1|nr:uncharacterized protein LOC125983864 [Syngnathus scovelli]
MKLVTITLLLFVHTADLTSNNCDGVKDQVVFCTVGSSLKIVPPATDYAWHFGTADVNVDSTLTTDPTSKELRGTLAAKHTGVYLATKENSPTYKFTIIVNAVSCSATTGCDVPTGGSFQLESTNANEAVSWEFKADGAQDFVPVSDSDKPKFREESSIKKGLGLFNVQKSESGTYRTKKASDGAIVDSFPVHVRDPVSAVTVREGGGCAPTLVCEVTGDAKTVKWTKDNTDAGTDGKTLTIRKSATVSASYVCKVTDYSNANKDSVAFPYAYTARKAVSKVTIERTASVLECTADGPVQSWEWLTFGNVPVTASDGTVGSDRSKFTLAPGAKGEFSCKATDCQDNTMSSRFLPVGGNVDPTGTPTDAGGTTTRGAATQGTSCSVALLVISVLIELYVVMMM